MTKLSDIKMYTKKDWGGKPPVRTLQKVKHTHLEVHHGASSNRNAVKDGFAVVRGYQKYHTATKGWSDIFYNTFLTPDNRLCIGRGLDTKSHGTALTLCLVGNYELVDVSPEMMGTIKLMAEATDGEIAGMDWHAQRARGTKYASACPGKFAIARIKELIEQGESLPVPNPSKPGVTIVEFKEAFEVVRQTYIDAWDRPGDPGGVIYWTELVMKDGFVGWVSLVRALEKVGQ